MRRTPITQQGALRLQEELENLKRVAQKLDNESFVSKAPAAVVDQQRAKKQELLEKRGKLEKLIEALKGK